MSLKSDSRGIAALAVVAVIVVVGLAGAGVYVWQNQNKDKSKDTNTSTTTDTSTAKCDFEDKDLCKFITSYKIHSKFNATLTGTSDGETISGTIAVDGEDKSHFKLSGGGFEMEVITIGKDVYTKATTGTWWKQTMTTQELNEFKEDYGVSDITELSEAENDEANYKKIGKEACGNLECFKYQYIDPKDTDTTTYLFFDTKDYQLRKVTTENGDDTSEMAISYENVSIKVPSPVKELGPNQVLVPGQDEPMTLPDYE